MKKSIFVVIVMMLTMSGTVAFAEVEDVKSDTEILAVPMSENKALEDEVTNMNKRLEEIRDMDKSELNAKEKKELRKELKKKKKGLGTIYIGGATLVLLIILIAILV
ncbi:MAG TPA: DUF6272 family protein [Dysgonamonadaceae bacterium]|nr:DUF6272 family protein [Dysgonamonadaceae bacterium]